MPNLPEKMRMEVLGNMYQQLSNGVHAKFGESAPKNLEMNFGNKLSHDRVIHFKTPEAEFEYFKKFSKGDTVVENMVQGLQSMARDTAIMRRLGPNAKGNLDEIVDDAIKSYIKDGRGDLAQQTKQEYDKLSKNLWPEITGEINIPANHMFAKISLIGRQVQMLGQLVNSVLSSMNDIPNYASVMRYTGDRTQGNYFSGMAEAVQNLVGNISKKPNPEQTQMISEMGILLDSLHSGLAQTGETTLSTGGDLSNWVRTLFKYNLQSFWSDSFRKGAALGTANRHASHMHLSFDQLPEGMQSLFNQFNMGKVEWDALRGTTAKLDSQGRSYLTPQHVDEIPDKVIDSFPEVKQRIDQILHKHGGGPQAQKYIESARKNARIQLQDNYRTLFNTVARWATTEPGAIERGILRQGTKPGTPEGELFRHAGMYKSFIVSTMRNHLGRELYGYGVDKLPIHKALFNMIKDPNGSSFGGMANLIVFGTLFGYGSMALKDLAKGRKPRTPTDAASFAKIFAASAAQSGAAGIYGDFLFGELKSRFGHGYVETLMGPTAGNFSDAIELFRSVRDGDDAGAKAFSFMLNNTPGVNSTKNLFYTKWAMDYLLIYRMQEMMNPGYLRRMERKLKKEKQQEYLVPPSKVIKYGGK
jgi:hypothetical protein